MSSCYKMIVSPSFPVSIFTKHGRMPTHEELIKSDPIYPWIYPTHITIWQIRGASDVEVFETLSDYTTELEPRNLSIRIDLHTDAGSTFDNRVTLTFCVTLAQLELPTDYMHAKFGVDRSSRFFLLEPGQTHIHRERKSQTPLITLPTHRLPSAWVANRRERSPSSVDKQERGGVGRRAASVSTTSGLWFARAFSLIELSSLN